MTIPPRSWSLLLAVLLAAIPGSLTAQFAFRTNADHTLTITYYHGPDTSVTIPATTNGMAVTGLGRELFFTNAILNNVAIPASITNIGPDVFTECPRLSSINVDPANPAYASPAGVLYNKSLTTLIQFPANYVANHYTLPATVTNIADRAFYGSVYLEYITIPASVTAIGSGTFQTSQLTWFYFEGNRPDFAPDAFLDTTNIVFYCLPGTSGWTTNGTNIATVNNSPNPAGSLRVNLLPAEAGAAGVRWQVDAGVPQPGGVTLTGLTLGRHTVTFLTNGAWAPPGPIQVVVTNTSVATASGTFLPQFSFATNSGAITLTGYNGPGDTVVVPATFGNLPVTTLGAGLFQSHSNVTAVSLPASIVSVGAGAFSGTGLRDVRFGAALAQLGASAFANCPGLQTVTFAGNAPSADATLFQGDTNVVVYYSVGASGWGTTFAGVPARVLLPFHYTTFAGAVSITGYSGLGGALVIPNTINGLPVVAIGDFAFADVDLAGITIPATVTNIGRNAFANCAGLTGLTLPSGLAAIEQFAFTGCFNLAAVTIPDSVRGIGDHAFEFCSSLKSVSLSHSVTNLGLNVFADCVSLTNLDIPASVTNLGPNSFNGCFALAAVTVGTNVQAFGPQSFAGCPNLTAIFCLGNAPVADGSAFSGDSLATVFYVPGTTGWNSTLAGLPVFPSLPNSVHVVLKPDSIVAGGPRWNLDGGAWQPSGTTLTNLSAGNHLLSFQPVTGWVAPANQVITGSANGVTAVAAYFTSVPTLTISSPSAGQSIPNGLVTFSGKTSDYDGILEVLYQLNNGPWQTAATANLWVNWTASVPLVTGTNILRAYAVNVAGNFSATNQVTVVAGNTFQLVLGLAYPQPLTAAGTSLLLRYSPGLNGHVQYSTNLSDWNNLTNFVATTTNATIVVVDPTSPKTGQRFYRAVVP